MKHDGFMHSAITLRRIIKTGFVNFVRNAWLAIAAMAMMLVTLTIVLFLVVANAAFTKTIKDITDKIDISIYLKDNVTEQQRTDLVGKLQRLDNVKSVTYKSKDDALTEYQKQNKNNLTLLLALSQTDNYLPASLQIKPKDPNKLDSLKTFIDKPEVAKLQSAPTSYSGSRKEAIDKISRSTLILREAAVVGIAIFTLVSILIIFNTIQMAIFNRRDELTIMRLLGASTGFIRGPFIVETTMYGIIAAIVSVILCGTLFTIASSAFEATSLGLLDIGYASDFFAAHFWLILTSQIAIGILIGAVSSLIATRRYLKFKTQK